MLSGAPALPLDGGAVGSALAVASPSSACGGSGRGPDTNGTGELVQSQFFITPNGNVGASTGTGLDNEVANCVAEVIKNIEFPKPKGGGGVQVNYPFIFHQTGAQ